METKKIRSTSITVGYGKKHSCQLNVGFLLHETSRRIETTVTGVLSGGEYDCDVRLFVWVTLRPARTLPNCLCDPVFYVLFSCGIYSDFELEIGVS